MACKKCGKSFGEMCETTCFGQANKEARASRMERRKTHGIFPALHSDALAVHPDQISDAEKDAAVKGVQTDFDKEGRPIFRSRQHRSKYLRAYGYYDKDAGYGDPAPDKTPVDVVARRTRLQEQINRWRSRYSGQVER